MAEFGFEMCISILYRLEKIGEFWERKGGREGRRDREKEREKIFFTSLYGKLTSLKFLSVDIKLFQSI